MFVESTLRDDFFSPLDEAESSVAIPSQPPVVKQPWMPLFSANKAVADSHQSRQSDMSEEKRIKLREIEVKSCLVVCRLGYLFRFAGASRKVSR